MIYGSSAAQGQGASIPGWRYGRLEISDCRSERNRPPLGAHRRFQEHCPFPCSDKAHRSEQWGLRCRGAADTLRAWECAASQPLGHAVSQVFNAAVKAVQSKWHITLLDRETETMSFDANSGLACSASFEELPGSSGVRVTLVSHAQNGAVGTFGMNGRIAKQLFKGIQDELSKQTKQPHD